MDCASFPKVIDKPCVSLNTETKTLPADVCIFGRFGRFSPVAVHSADCWFHSGVKWWTHVSSIVTYLRKNSFSLRWNSCKQHSESSTRCYFCSTVSKHSTHCEHSFFIDKYSWKIVNTLPSDIFKSSAISCDRLYQLWSFLFVLFFCVCVFSETTAEFGQPERSVSFVSV